MSNSKASKGASIFQRHRRVSSDTGPQRGACFSVPWQMWTQFSVWWQVWYFIQRFYGRCEVFLEIFEYMSYIGCPRFYSKVPFRMLCQFVCCVDRMAPFRDPMIHDSTISWPHNTWWHHDLTSLHPLRHHTLEFTPVQDWEKPNRKWTFVCSSPAEMIQFSAGCDFLSSTINVETSNCRLVPVWLPRKSSNGNASYIDSLLSWATNRPCIHKCRMWQSSPMEWSTVPVWFGMMMRD